MIYNIKIKCILKERTNIKIMSTIVIFDTETTGLVNNNMVSNITPENIHLCPYIVQVSFIVYNVDEEKMEKMHDSIIKIPDGVIISEEVANIHKITTEISRGFGLDIETELINIIKFMQSADTVIAHNIEFDINIIIVELNRLIYKYTNELANLDVSTRSKTAEYIEKIDKYKEYIGIVKYIGETKGHCTMKKNITRCGIKTISKKSGKEFVKFPKLGELHNYLFQTFPKNLHNALVDVIVCLRCYLKIRYNKDFYDTNHGLAIVNEM
jgi:DNA polymerase III epsilon subunit-like protein